MVAFNKLTLSWPQAKMLKEQIEVAQEARAFGPIGKLTMDNGCVVEWDKHEVNLEIPDKEGNARPFPEG